MYNDHSLFTDTSPSGLFAPLDLSLLPDEKTALSIEGLNLHYGQTQALFDINMRIAKGQVTAFIGPSGCGKSTLLSCINRMNDLIDGCHIDGKVMLHGQNVYDKNVDVAALRRQVGMVFQRPNPFPKSIYENVVYGLRLQGVSDRRVLDDAVENSLRSAALWDEVKGRLHENAFGLSGGQQQRLVIARAIAIEPEILLLDEPTSALDPISTLTIEELINDLKAKYTVIIVTHNMQQAARVSDQTAFMHMGELVEYTSTNDIFTTPKEKRTEDYITGRYG
ncbi:phosphate ABC transporter ATP-binding protein [Photobacterium aquimaris]|uniref:Phosphate ABC transporter ATP-binding protein n=2 Tax=Photobacterium TaxID=657 RepID=A0A2T3IJD6_9GAMM|nr:MULTISPECIES: phosphate ABC transporter ATP-binding protein PstB [Photobacterium]OBU16517.1 phosphate ABC transporter ATP-binding protein [Photobacterium aquimaris]OBU18143.1 phosphate ABC transporter ATP-binding protein [Photobacterium aquimaris]PSU28469.1 phosphate ABC transporter ATP-binding protein [Photobacterium aquimaris]PSW02721.1 phosphate ABC transporter ATP-binding protein [Photobacterium aquimaris]SMY38232.1 Phosphate import ATP-binding protein PstB 3 [Photobacterium malacitanum